jgi:hypothetical protein
MGKGGGERVMGGEEILLCPCPLCLWEVGDFKYIYIYIYVYIHTYIFIYIYIHILYGPWSSI